MNPPKSSRDPIQLALDLGITADQREPRDGSAFFCLDCYGHPDSDDGRIHFFWFENQDELLTFLSDHLINFLQGLGAEFPTPPPCLGDAIEPLRGLATLPQKLNVTVNKYLEGTDWEMLWAGTYTELLVNPEYLEKWKTEAQARLDWWGPGDEDSGATSA